MFAKVFSWTKYDNFEKKNKKRKLKNVCKSILKWTKYDNFELLFYALKIS